MAAGIAGRIKLPPFCIYRPHYLARKDRRAAVRGVASVKRQACVQILRACGQANPREPATPCVSSPINLGVCQTRTQLPPYTLPLPGTAGLSRRDGPPHARLIWSQRRPFADAAPRLTARLPYLAISPAVQASQTGPEPQPSRLCLRFIPAPCPRTGRSAPVCPQRPPCGRYAACGSLPCLPSQRAFQPRRRGCDRAAAVRARPPRAG